MVDWSLARQVARLAARGGDMGEPGFDVRASCAEMEPYVAGYTGLVLASDPPPPEAIGRSDWSSANLDSLARMLDPVAERLDDRLAFAGPLAGALRAGASATLAAEAGRLGARVDKLVAGATRYPPNRRLLDHLAREREHLFTFLRMPGVQATNWRAEQAIRPAVVTRKVWGGNRTWAGATTWQTLTSVLRTASQQSHDPVELLAGLLRTPGPIVADLAIPGR
ncbi:MAG: zinc-dependent metalloprotease [Thermoleophilia bacterium]